MSKSESDTQNLVKVDLNKQYRAFMFTCHHGFDFVFSYLKKVKHIEYLLIGGYERGEKQKEEAQHNHSYLQFDRPRNIKRIFNDLDHYGHMDFCQYYGSSYAVCEYCKKVEKEEDGRMYYPKKDFGNNQVLYEQGKFKLVCFGQGARSDLKNALCECTDSHDFLMKNPDLFSKYKCSIDRYYKTKNARQDIQRKISIYKGERHIQVDYHTGTGGSGKTYNLGKEMEELDDLGVEMVDISFDQNGFLNYEGYETATVMIINEFRPSDIRFSDFLKLLTNEGVMNVKGAYIKFPNIRKILISCYIPPEKIYANLPENYDKSQIKRRITNIYEHSFDGKQYVTKLRNWDDEI